MLSVNYVSHPHGITSAIVVNVVRLIAPPPPMLSVMLRSLSLVLQMEILRLFDKVDIPSVADFEQFCELVIISLKTNWITQLCQRAPPRA